MTSSAASPVPTPANLALSHAWLWAKAALPLAQRLDLDDGQGSGLPDAMVLLVALRNVHRAAEMAVRHLTDATARQVVRDALAAFDAELPGLVDARDIIEHFDEYRLGKGRLQKRNPASRTADQLAEDYAPHLHYGTASYPQITLGPYVLDLSRAALASQHLGRDLRVAVSSE
jgi:hypothetical protein